jgi:hypothetical protein
MGFLDTNGKNSEINVGVMGWIGDICTTNFLIE